MLANHISSTSNSPNIHSFETPNSPPSPSHQNNYCHRCDITGKSTSPKISGGIRKKRSCTRWTEEENKRLMEAYIKHEGKNWSAIAKAIGNKTSDQCNQHWHRVLNPKISKKPWTEAEDASLIRRVNEFGESSWKKISEALDGRTDLQCRHRWTQLKKSMGGSSSPARSQKSATKQKSVNHGFQSDDISEITDNDSPLMSNSHPSSPSMIEFSTPSSMFFQATPPIPAFHNQTFNHAPTSGFKPSSSMPDSTMNMGMWGLKQGYTPYAMFSTSAPAQDLGGFSEPCYQMNFQQPIHHIQSQPLYQQQPKTAPSMISNYNHSFPGGWNIEYDNSLQNSLYNTSQGLTSQPYSGMGIPEDEHIESFLKDAYDMNDIVE